MLEIIGIFLILLGFLLIVLSKIPGVKVYYGFGGFIGPIPFGFANHPVLLISIILLTFLSLFIFLWLNFFH